MGPASIPLSRPECPKPFLPLLDERSLLQRTVARLAGLTDDITVVTDRRYERLVKEQVPDAALVLEPLGRNTAAAIALATLAIDRPEDEVMVVLPADQTVERDDVFRAVLRTRPPTTSRPGPSGSTEPLVTLGIQVDRPATDYGYLIPDLARGADVDGAARLPARPLRGEAQAGPRRRAGQARGRRLERGHLPVAAGGHPRGARPLHRACSSRSARCSAARPPSSAPTRRSRGRSRSTTR